MSGSSPVPAGDPPADPDKDPEVSGSPPAAPAASRPSVPLLPFGDEGAIVADYEDF